MNSYQWLFEAPPVSAGSAVRGQTVRETVSRFPRYSNSVQSLPPQERAKINAIAQAIVRSYGPGQNPIRTVQLIGHADQDTPRRPDFEKKISGDRALTIQAALSTAIERFSHIRAAYPPMPPISTRINWQRVTVGANQRLNQIPRSELERSQNRRVEIFMYPIRRSSQFLFTRSARLGLSTQTALATKIEQNISEFCSRVGEQDVDRSNCFKAVEEIIRALSKKAPKGRSCSLGYSGSQLIESKYTSP
jgi:hypothetical protein